MIVCGEVTELGEPQNFAVSREEKFRRTSSSYSFATVKTHLRWHDLIFGEEFVFFSWLRRPGITYSENMAFQTMRNQMTQLTFLFVPQDALELRNDDVMQ